MTLRHHSGFTLIELMVAVAVFAVLGALAYGGLNRVLATQTHIEQSMERLRALQLTFRYLQRDFELLINRPVRDQFGDLQPALRSGEERGAENWLSLTHAGWRNPAGLRRSTLQRVEYALDEQEEYDNLLRLAWPLLDGYGADTEQEEDEDGYAGDAVVTPLLTGIEELKIRFLDEQNAWQDVWPPLDSPSAARNAPGISGQLPGAPAETFLPRAVEITLVAEPWGEIRRLMALPR